jgi:predicted transcriptional regulator
VENFSDLEADKVNSAIFDERCVQLFKSINEYHAAGFSKRKIARLLRVSRPTVYKYIDGDFEALCRRQIRSGMDTYHDYIVKSLKAGFSRKDVYKSVVAMGFKGKISGAYEYMNKLIAYYGIEISVYWSTSADAIQRRKQILQYDYITRTELFKFLWMNADLEPEHREYIFKKHPQFYILYVCVKEFRQIFEKNSIPRLNLFIDKYKRSDLKELSIFAKGLEKDIEAVENAVCCNLSNGFVEGSVMSMQAYVFD